MPERAGVSAAGIIQAVERLARAEADLEGLRRPLIPVLHQETEVEMSTCRDGDSGYW